jgi:hypothetical protein
MTSKIGMSIERTSPCPNHIKQHIVRKLSSMVLYGTQKNLSKFHVGLKPKKLPSRQQESACGAWLLNYGGTYIHVHIFVNKCWLVEHYVKMEQVLSLADGQVRPNRLLKGGISFWSPQFGDYSLDTEAP